MDETLKRALRYQMEAATPDEGVVVACIVDESIGEEVCEVSRREGESVVHAERRASKVFVARHGQPSDDSYIVTSLSPCSRYDEVNRLRRGGSCADLLAGNGDILDTGIDRVHTGYMDPWQADMRDLGRMGLEVTVTRDEDLRQGCEDLFGYFMKDDEAMRRTDISSHVYDSLSHLL